MPDLALMSAAVTLAGGAVWFLAALGGVARFSAYYDWWSDCEREIPW